jgi:uncharacterized membrane protein YbaN (DUF454 family)
MVRHIRRGMTIFFGVFFLLLGVISGFLPVIQGWIFVLIGLTLLAKELPFVHHRLERLKDRFPTQIEQLHRLKARWCPGRAAEAGSADKRTTSVR